MLHIRKKGNETMKILYVTTISSTMAFFPEHIRMLQAGGHTVELAANFSRPADDRVTDLSCICHHIPFSRSVGSKGNVRAFLELKKLLHEGDYDIVHTHTPNASVIVRLACRKMRKKGLRVFYTAHGFHFYKGASVKNWMFFFPVEWVCARWTDVLITINREDYRFAKRWMKPGRVEYVPGVGIDTAKYNNVSVDIEEKRREMGIRNGDVMLLSVGELNQNKNHEAVIRALAGINDKKLHYMIAGRGCLFKNLCGLADQLGVGERVHLLGYRDDVAQLYQCADIYLLPSAREGLNVSLMEAMASRLPCIVSKIRGNEELVVEGKGGLLCGKPYAKRFADAIKKLADDKSMRLHMGTFNRERVKKFGNDRVLKKMKGIYQE